MTKSITQDPKLQEDATFEKSFLGIFGYAMFLAYSLICLFFNVQLTPESEIVALPFLLRGIGFAVAAISFFVLFRFIRQRDALVRSRIAMTCAFVFQIVVPIQSFIESMIGTTLPLPIALLAWLLWGLAYAYFFCAWIDTQSRISESSVVKNHIYSFLIAGLVTTGVLSMSALASEIIVVIMAAFSFFALLNIAPQHIDEEPQYTERLLRERIKFNKIGSYILLIDGAILGFASSYLIDDLFLYDLPIAIVGVALLCSAGLFYLLKRMNPSLLSLENSQLVFLPILICGPLVAAFSEGIWTVIFAFLLFVALAVIDFVNASILSLRGNLLSASPTYCFSKGRVFLTMGQCLGWMCGAFVFTQFGAFLQPFVAIFLALLVCLHIAIAVTAPDKFPLVRPEETEEIPQKYEGPFKRNCAKAAQIYKLTPRESEILFYLAKGRNAGFIAGNLFVAERTVKTHTYHIYQKMGIHSQQELIDIVESN